jgi:membrane protein implicated in regulation of membrane protease activity
MSEDKEKQETRYPLRSMHDFLYELDKEWDRFRTGSLIGLIVSGALLLFSVFRVLSALRNRAVFELLFMLVVVAALVYTISALLAQHRFFKKWERRIGLLLHMEEKILGEELEKDG